MEFTDIKRLFANFNGNAPAAGAALRQFELDSDFRLPPDYVGFMQQMNGGEGFIGNQQYLILWPVEELLKMNRAYEVAEYAPDLFLFGSDGGGEAFAFDRRSNDSIVSVPFVGMDTSLVRRQGSKFQEFLEQLSRS